MTTGYEGEEGRARADVYESLTSVQVFEQISDLLPSSPVAILDVGSGSGRDAAWFSSEGHTVVAVEPSQTMSSEARRRHGDSDVEWLSDSLPALSEVYRTNMSFEAIFLSAVWMHVPPADRVYAFRKMVGLLRSNGRIFISLRLGPPDVRRNMFAVSPDEIETLACKHAMVVLRQTESVDMLGRKDISWVNIVLQLQDDGTGALPLLRNVILNDAKSSTYKLGLLRAIARVADGAQGMAHHLADEVRIPFGLVALNWIRLYQPLLLFDMPQTPKNRGIEGLSFVKADWATIAKLAAADLRVGAQFSQERAAAIHRSIQAVTDTIARMPARYTTYPGSENPVFPVYNERCKRKPGHLMIDEGYLRSFGELSIPIHLWRALVRFDAWIEPALIAEWIRLMENYARTQIRELDPVKLVQAMHWHNPSRDVSLVRKRVIDVMHSQPVYCVWTGKRLRGNSLDIDHCLPWAAWPCEDLWNLLPSNPSVNRNSKRDKLPSADMLKRSSERIIDWWNVAWKVNPSTDRRFTTEAKASLPITSPSPDMSEIFCGLKKRRVAIRADHQVAEWSL